MAKAKAVRPFAEKMITLGKRDDLHSRRVAFASLRQKEAVRKLFAELAPRPRAPRAILAVFVGARAVPDASARGSTRIPRAGLKLICAGSNSTSTTSVCPVIDVAFAVVVKEAAERALGTVGARNAILIGHRASVCIVGFMMRRRCFCHEKRSIARYIK